MNKECTRYFSDRHEKSVCKALKATQQPNSGAGKFRKGDCVQSEASLLIECKCAMSDKSSISIKEEWLTKNKEEAFQNRLSNSCVCFNFGPDSKNYYIIDEPMMKFLVERLSEN